MAIANIDTFEHDISDEIKNKEATIGDIAAAAGDVGNTPQINTISPLLLISVIILCLSGIIGGGLLGYIYYTKQKTIASQPKDTPLGPAVPTIALSTISPELDRSIGRFISNIQRSEFGYSMTINSYPPVYAYMIKNESLYADEIATAVGAGRDMSSSTTVPFTFTDVTENNQNIRVGTSESKTISYAFVNNTKTLLIASTVENILKLSSAILP